MIDMYVVVIPNNSVEVPSWFSGANPIEGETSISWQVEHLTETQIEELRGLGFEVIPPGDNPLKDH